MSNFTEQEIYVAAASLLSDPKHVNSTHNEMHLYTKMYYQGIKAFIAYFQDHKSITITHMDFTNNIFGINEDFTFAAFVSPTSCLLEDAMGRSFTFNAIISPGSFLLRTLDSTHYSFNCMYGQ